MQGRAFYDRIQSDSRFEWLGVRSCEAGPGGIERRSGEVLVRRLGTEAKRAVFAVDVAEITRFDWKVFEEIFTGYRRPRVMLQMTRIVGYYAFLHNFNRSKLAEVRDRGKGNYALTESR